MLPSGVPIKPYLVMQPVISDKQIDQILAENEKRWKRLRAEYDPVTGEGVSELTGLKRVKLEISDYATPVQWVLNDDLQNRFPDVTFALVMDHNYSE